MKLRVWHIPQVPMKPFIVEVGSVEEGVRMMDALADYDAFQYDNNIKPDYCNANGLQMFDESLTDQIWKIWNWMIAGLIGIASASVTTTRVNISKA